MQITSAKFVKGINGSDKILEDGMPQIAFIGRSNVGKSSVINSLTNQKDLAKTSSFPGRTKEINLFIINKSMYLLDLPGYGYAKASHEVRMHLFKLIDWYLFKSPYRQKKVVFIIDGSIGPTNEDLDMFQALEDFKKNIVVVASKIDKIKKSNYEDRFCEIRNLIGDHKIIPYSSHAKIGIDELTCEVLG